MQPNDDKYRKLREWDREVYEKTHDPAHTEFYNGFTIEIRLCTGVIMNEQHLYGHKFFIITPDNKIYTNGYAYLDSEHILNEAYNHIDNGEVPEDV